MKALENRGHWKPSCNCSTKQEVSAAKGCGGKAVHRVQLGEEEGVTIQSK